MRYFIGIALPKQVTSELMRIQTLLKKENLFTGRFIKPDNLHITMLFLGSKTDEEIRKISQDLSSVRTAPCTVQLGTVEVPHWSPARVLWVTLPSDHVSTLYEELITVLPEHKEKREFTAHCTIARIKKVDDKQALKAFLATVRVEPLSWEIDSFSLYSSQTYEEGPEYTLVNTYRLHSS